METSSVLYGRFFPSTTATNIYLHSDYFILLTLCLLVLFYLDLLHTHAVSSEQVKLRRKRVIAIMRWARGNSHVRFHDVTSWSYVNLDDPLYKQSPKIDRIV